MTDLIQTKFNEFHRENPQVYSDFCAYTLQVIKQGFKKFSAKAVWERLRWHYDIETRGEKYAMNNNYTAYYARMFMNDHPQYAGFFETRERKDNGNSCE